MKEFCGYHRRVGPANDSLSSLILLCTFRNPRTKRAPSPARNSGARENRRTRNLLFRRGYGCLRCLSLSYLGGDLVVPNDLKVC